MGKIFYQIFFLLTSFFILTNHAIEFQPRLEHVGYPPNCEICERFCVMKGKQNVYHPTGHYVTRDSVEPAGGHNAGNILDLDEAVTIEFIDEVLSSITPKADEDLDIDFLLYTNDNQHEPFILKHDFNISDLIASPFNGIKMVTFIVHGYWSYFSDYAWTGSLKDAILTNLPNAYNVIGVNWREGASSINYLQAVSNVEVVGAMLAKFIRKLNKFSSMELENVHLIGHSLGAHACGYAGKKFENPKIGIITGLDPAKPRFQNAEKFHRLHSTDASYVEVLHTGCRVTKYIGYGLSQIVGDVDFYPNNGTMQPGCKKYFKNTIEKGIAYTLSCNHVFATSLAIDNLMQSTYDCQMVGYQCPSYAEFLDGRCIDCGIDQSKCAAFGQNYRQADHAPHKRIVNATSQKFYFLTNKESPLCSHHYGIELHLSRDSATNRGSFSIEIIGDLGSIDVNIDYKGLIFTPYTIYTSLTNGLVFLGEIKSANLHWKLQTNVKLNGEGSSSMAVSYILIQYMSHIDERIRRERSEILCPDVSRISSGQTIQLVPCAVNTMTLTFDDKNNT